MQASLTSMGFIFSFEHRMSPVRGSQLRFGVDVAKGCLLVALVLLGGVGCGERVGRGGRLGRGGPRARPRPHDPFARCFEVVRRYGKDSRATQGLLTLRPVRSVRWVRSVPESDLSFVMKVAVPDRPTVTVFLGRIRPDLRWRRRAGARYVRAWGAHRALADRFASFLHLLNPLWKPRAKEPSFVKGVRRRDQRSLRRCVAGFDREERILARRLRAAISHALRVYGARVRSHSVTGSRVPETLLLMAELHLERAELDRQDRHRRKGEGPKPSPDLAAGLARCRRILKRFPNFAGRQKALYLLAYAWKLMAERALDSEVERVTKKAQGYYAHARQAFLGLVCANHYDPLAAPRVVSLGSSRAPYQGCRPQRPKQDRRLLAHAWFHIGKDHFERDPPLPRLTKRERAQALRTIRLPTTSAAERAYELEQELLGARQGKLLRLMRLNKDYARSAYSQLLRRFPDIKALRGSALYNRARASFRNDQYLAAASDLDLLLIREKAPGFYKSAVRLIALCAYYHKGRQSSFRWLIGHYRGKKWLNDRPDLKLGYVKAVFHQLAEVHWEESRPPKGLNINSAANRDAVRLESALRIYRWILSKGGFDTGAAKAANPDRDWQYYRGKAPIQLRILKILGLLHRNVDKRVRARYPCRMIVAEWKRARDRFGTAPGCAHRSFAKEYERRWGRDPEVAAALAVLRRAGPAAAR